MLPDARSAVAARRQADRLDRAQRRRQLDRQPGEEGRQTRHRRQLAPKASLLHWLHEAGVEYQKVRLQFAAAVPDSFLLGTQAHDHGDPPRRPAGWCWSRERRNGCWNSAAHYQAADGTVKELTTEMRDEVRKRLSETTAQAMRTLAFAYARPAGGASRRRRQPARHPRRPGKIAGLRRFRGHSRSAARRRQGSRGRVSPGRDRGQDDHRRQRRDGPGHRPARSACSTRDRSHAGAMLTSHASSTPSATTS